ncbi:MAG: magnesium transporter [Deinococcota bacterium]|nr:magnesium transporter [Deinococcota bacterium]
MLHTHTRLANEVLPEEIARLIEEKRWAELSSRRVAWPDSEMVAPELVDFLLELDKEDRVLLFRALPRRLATEVFAYLEPEPRDALLRELTDGETRQLLANLNPDDRTGVLEELPGRVTQRLLNLLSPEDLEEARQLLGYPEESVGRLMTPDYVAVKPEWSVDRALEHIRRLGRRSETINMIYVHDDDWKLLDALPLQSFILAKPDKTVSDIMDYSFASLRASDDREEAVRMMQRYDRVALPVVDSQGILLGIVTVDDVFDVAEEEVTEDFHKSAAVTPLNRGYWQASLWNLYSSRIGWLATLVMVSLVSSGVIGIYEEVLESVVALAFFMPLVIGTGGNAGTQAATMMIRALSTGDVEIRQWFRAFLREIAIGFTLGVSLGALGMVLGIFRGGYEVGLIVLLTMMVMLVITNLLGMSLPFILTKLGLDPASASGPLVASIADAIGLLVYFAIASRVLGF